MHRLVAIAIACSLISLGCSKNEPAKPQQTARAEQDIEKKSAAETPRKSVSSPGEQHSNSPPSNFSSNTSLVLPPLTGEQEQLQQTVTDLANLMLQAKRQEAAFEFDQSIATWEEIKQVVEKQHGTTSWQARNAELGLKSAKQRASMDFEQRRTLYELDRLDRQADQIQDAEPVEALRMRARVSELARQLWDSKSHLVALYLYKQAQGHQRVGQFPEAETLMRQTLTIREPLTGKAHPDYVAALHALSILYQQQKQWEIATESMIESVELAKVIWGDDSKAYATYLNDQGVLQHATGNQAAALMSLQKAIGIYDRLEGSHQFDHAHCRYNLATVQMAKGDQESALKNFRRCEKEFVELKSDNHDMVLESRTQLATIYLLQQDAESAEELLKKVVDARRARPNFAQSPAYAKSVFQWAVTLGKQGKYKEAEPAFREAYRMQAELLPSGHADLTRTASTWAIVLRKLGRESEAETLESQTRMASRAAETHR